MIDITQADKVFGWTSCVELTWLAEQASKRKNIVEVGSWQGRSAVAMATNTKGNVLAVDTWLGTPEDGHFKLLADKPEDWLFEEFKRNADGIPNLRWLRGKSVDVARSLPQVPQFDMIFIDAAHDYENVKADIKAWIPLLLPGGLFAGHDADFGRPGVIKALREIFPKYHKVPYGSLWMKPLN